MRRNFKDPGLASRLEGGRWLLLGTWRDGANVRVEPFEAIELELGGLWAR
jgi:hypothetical protein